MDDLHMHKRFLTTLAATFLFICLGAATFNYLVDPYGLFGSPRLAGFNVHKPAAAERVRVAKPYMAVRSGPGAIIGGNSRPEIGLDPQSECWGSAGQPVFNAAIPGANVFMQVRYVQHAAGRGNTRRILFGVDFLDFLVDAREATGKVDWNRLGLSFEDRLHERSGLGLPVNFLQTEDMLGGLFSMTTLSDAITTIAAQRDAYSATRRDDGFNPAQDYLPIIRSEGQAVLFLQKNAEVRKRLQPEELGVLDAAGEQTMPLMALRRLLRWAASRDIEVVLFINPYHSDYLVQIAASGKWELLDEWKRKLAAIADEHAVSLWDFNAIDPYSTERPPARNDRNSVLKWYWEPAHYRAELGDLMLGAMLGHACGRTGGSKPIGTRVTQAGLQAHLDRLRADLQRFMTENPDVVDRLAAPDT